MIEVMQLLATFAAGIWTGAAIYIGFVEHPSSRSVGDTFAVQYFRNMSKRTAPLMMILSATSGLSACTAWYQGGETAWLIGGLLQLSLFPITGLLIVPTNIKLVRLDPAGASEESSALLNKWSRMHWIRTLVGSISFPLFLWLLTR